MFILLSTNIYWVLTETGAMPTTVDLQINRTSSLPSRMLAWQERKTRERQWHLEVVDALIEEAEDWEHTAHPTEVGALIQAKGCALEVPSSHTTGLLRCPAPSWFWETDANISFSETFKAFSARDPKVVMLVNTYYVCVWTCPSLI